MIVLTTNYGDIHVELDFEKAPNTATNFQKYVASIFLSFGQLHKKDTKISKHDN